MNLIVQKFGGSSISDVNKIINISSIITNTYNKGYDVIAVVSAQGNTTNQLIKKMLDVTLMPSKQEMDILLSVGEQISIALLTAYLKKQGYSVVALTGWQAGIYTDSVYGNARIKYIDKTRILKELKERNIVVVAGFQGIDKNENITTLGRGGSDTSAVALAVNFNADICQIFTDVDGVYTADPRLVKTAKKIDEITFDEMLAMASLGAKVLHNRSVELAKKHNLEIEVISSFSQNPGTRVKGEITLNTNSIRGITCDENILLISLKKEFEKLNEVFSKLEENNILISAMSLNDNRYLENETGSNARVDFIVPKDQKFNIKKILDNQILDKKILEINEDVAKVSIVGSGLMSNPNVLFKLLKILSKNNISPKFISTGEIFISMIVDAKIYKNFMNLLHDEYKLGDEKR